MALETAPNTMQGLVSIKTLEYSMNMFTLHPDTLHFQQLPKQQQMIHGSWADNIRHIHITCDHRHTLSQSLPMPRKPLQS